MLDTFPISGLFLIKPSQVNSVLFRAFICLAVRSSVDIKQSKAFFSLLTLMTILTPYTYTYLWTMYTGKAGMIIAV